MELLDGSRLIAKEHRTALEPDHPVAVHQAGFIQYLDSGVWHLAFYNDGRNVEAVSYNTIVQGEWDTCVGVTCLEDVCFFFCFFSFRKGPVCKIWLNL